MEIPAWVREVGRHGTGCVGREGLGFVGKGLPGLGWETAGRLKEVGRTLARHLNAWQSVPEGVAAGQ